MKRNKKIKKKIKKLYKKYITGEKTLNEMRKELGLSPVDNGDVLVTTKPSVTTFYPIHIHNGIEQPRKWKAYITENVNMNLPMKSSININGIPIPTYDGLLDEIRKLNREITKTRIISAVQTIILVLAVIGISIKII